MVKQYPYFLWVQSVGSSTVNADGQPIKPVSTWHRHSRCRDEVNSQGQTVTLEDGEAPVYNALVQLPKTCPPVARNTVVEVRTECGQVRQKGSVLRFSPDQLHCRLWL